MNVEEILTSVGISGGLYGLYKIAVRLYNKYYINSECHNLSEHSTDIVVHISEVEPKKEEKREPPSVEMVRGSV